MAKATSRKHATHRKSRTHHASKTHTRRSSSSSASGTSRSSSAGGVNPIEIARDAEIVDDDSTARPGPRSADQETEEELGIYGASRGESAGESDEATS